jgi:hypothetical protein
MQPVWKLVGIVTLEFDSYQLFLNLIYFYCTLIDSFNTSSIVFIEVLYIIKESIYELWENRTKKGGISYENL